MILPSEGSHSGIYFAMQAWTVNFNVKGFI